MRNLIKTMPIVATAALLVAGAFLYAGCEKEKPQKEETHNPLCGTTWVEYGYTSFFCEDEDTNIHDSYHKDTILFLTDNEMEYREADGAIYKSTYLVVEDSLLYISNDKIVCGIKRHNFKFIDEDNLLIKLWWSRDITGTFYNVYFKKIKHEN